ILDRPVAIKFLSSVVSEPAIRDLFLVEARAAARVHHPNVVAIHRVGSVADRPFLVTELIRGRSLNKLPKPLPWQRVVRIGIDLCRGLAAAHREGILHRDIKPANAIEADEGVVKLVDFGSATFVATRGAHTGPIDPMAASAVPLDD